MHNKQLIMLGDVNVDNIWPVPAIPKPGRDGLVDTVKMECGGAILNSTILLDRLGVPTVLLACLGEDLWASYIWDALSSTGIDMSAVQTTGEKNTGLDFILVTPDGERTMVGYRGANVLLHPDKIPASIFENVGIVHISGYALLEPPQSDGVMRAVEFAIVNQIPISIDTGLEPVMRNVDAFSKILPALEICIIGIEEVDYLLGAVSAEEAGEKLIETGVNMAAIKMGEAGSLLKTKDKAIHCPCFDVEVIDTTGAGDAYTAGILYGYYTGLSMDAIGMLASALGALATTVNGAGLSLPRQEELNTLLREKNRLALHENEHITTELLSHFN